MKKGKKYYVLPPSLTAEEVSRELKIPYRKISEWQKGNSFPPAFAEAKIIEYAREKSSMKNTKRKR